MWVKDSCQKKGDTTKHRFNSVSPGSMWLHFGARSSANVSKSRTRVHDSAAENSFMNAGLLQEICDYVIWLSHIFLAAKDNI